MPPDPPNSLNCSVFLAFAAAGPRQCERLEPPVGIGVLGFRQVLTCRFVAFQKSKHNLVMFSKVYRVILQSKKWVKWPWFINWVVASPGPLGQGSWVITSTLDVSWDFREWFRRIDITQKTFKGATLCESRQNLLVMTPIFIISATAFCKRDI